MTEQNTSAISKLQQKANAGDTQAQFDLALCYVNKGTDTEKNTKLAFDWHKKAADQGHVNAQFSLGLYYFLGVNDQHTVKLIDRLIWGNATNKSVDPALDLAFNQAVTSVKVNKGFTKANDALAFIWFKKASRQNHVESSYWLGQCYQNGWGTEKNEKLAFECFKKLTEQEFEEAYYDLALCYQKGKGIEQSDELAFEWYKKAAEENIREAQYWLACCYFEGKYVSQNNEIGFSWMSKSANSNNGGYVEAIVYLAECYEQGIGTEKSDEKAYKCYERAATSSKDNAKSQYWLARYYFYGGIQNQLGDIDRHILATESNPELCNMILEKGYERAFSWAEQAADTGCTEAYLLLGFMSMYGIGVRQDNKRAAKYFKEAAKFNQQGIADYFLADYYTYKNDDKLAGFYLKRSSSEKVLQYYDIEKLLENDEKLFNSLFFLSIRIHSELGNYDLSRNLIEKNKRNSTEAAFALGYVAKVEQIEKKNKELHEKEKEMLSFFTHTMRNALATAPESLRQAIYLLGSDVYEKDIKHYKAINKIASLFSTLSLTDCLIDTFKQSISDPQEFQQAWKMDNSGEATPEWVIASALRQSLNRIIFMSDTTELRKLLSSQETTFVKTIRKYFIDEVLPLNLNKQDIDTFYEWINKNMPSINVLISDTDKLHFGVNQNRFSLLFAITSELILNALKYWDGENSIQICWHLEEQENYIFSVTNHCMKNASSNLAGTHKGLAFIERLVELLGDQAMFKCEDQERVFEAELILNKTLFNEET